MPSRTITFNVTAPPEPPSVRYTPGHYVSLQRIDKQDFTLMAAAYASAPQIKGFVTRWTWLSFEPSMNNYAFATHPLITVLDWCQARGLKLIVMIEHVTFGYLDNAPHPPYLNSWTGVNLTPGANTTGFASNVTGASWALSNTIAPSAQLVTIRGDTATNHSAKTALITGTTAGGAAQTETINLPNGTDIATTTKEFKTVTSVVPSATIGASTMDIGWAPRTNGYTITIWDTVVVGRLKALLTAFGAYYGDHPALEGVMIEETAANMVSSEMTTPPAGKLWAPYTATACRDAFIEIMAHWATVRPDIRWFFYMNFLQGNQTGTFLNAAVQASPNCVICGPDAEWDNAALNTRTYWIYRQNNTIRPVACFASTQVYQSGATGEEIYDFSINDLGGNFMMWVCQSVSNADWTGVARPQILEHPTWPAMAEDWT
jgi:hypothetical protein